MEENRLLCLLPLPLSFPHISSILSPVLSVSSLILSSSPLSTFLPYAPFSFFFLLSSPLHLLSSLSLLVMMKLLCKSRSNRRRGPLSSSYPPPKLIISVINASKRKSERKRRRRVEGKGKKAIVPPCCWLVNGLPSMLNHPLIHGMFLESRCFSDTL